jgi:hypothetical protein
MNGDKNNNFMYQINQISNIYQTYRSTEGYEGKGKEIKKKQRISRKDKDIGKKEGMLKRKGIFRRKVY